MTWCIRTDMPVLLPSLPCIDTSALIGTIMLQLSLLGGGTGGGNMPYVMYTRVIEHSPPQEVLPSGGSRQATVKCPMSGYVVDEGRVDRIASEGDLRGSWAGRLLASCYG